MGELKSVVNAEYDQVKMLKKELEEIKVQHQQHQHEEITEPTEYMHCLWRRY